MSETGRIAAVFGNMVTAHVDTFAVLNSVAYCRRRDGTRLLAEIIRISGDAVDLQVFEETRGLRVGDPVELTGNLVEAQLGPGLLGRIYDGLQNPLPELAAKHGTHLLPGRYLPPLDPQTTWRFTPSASVGQKLRAGGALGHVTEHVFEHPICVPFGWRGSWTVEAITSPGDYGCDARVAVLRGEEDIRREATLCQRWPVKVPLCVCDERLLPTEPLVTKIRIVDTLFPVVKGGTYCIPGPFGAGKTVLQHITSRHAEIDVVVIAACGERAGEVVELLREFPELTDPRDGQSLMKRTIIICNTSSMPVAAREASVYTAVTLAEYYRQMGLNVLLLADSTSRWAQALRELSGRLEEIPGEEAFPAYLESRIANFYERAGAIRLHDGRVGSLTIGGTVSPAGGNFEEPVTQGTLKVVGAFHGLSRARSDARRYPAIDPIESWSTYEGIISQEARVRAVRLLKDGNEIKQMMAVVGEEGTGIDDFATMLAAELFDAVFLQQNAFDDVDAASDASRQRLVFDKVFELIDAQLVLDNKEHARAVFVQATEMFKHWNYEAPQTPGFDQALAEIDDFIGRGGRTL